MNFNKHLLISSSKIKSALKLLSSVGLDTTLFAVNKNNKLIGSISDGDIRRGLLRGISLDDPITEIINKKPKFIRKGNYSIGEIKKLRKNNYKLVPVIDNDDVIVNVISFRSISSNLPIDVVIMAGGLGSRLKPMTDKIQKQLLKTCSNKKQIIGNIVIVLNKKQNNINDPTGTVVTPGGTCIFISLGRKKSSHAGRKKPSP